jgi:hypothetical protein
MGKLKNIQPKRNCPNQYSAATKNPSLKFYAQFLVRGGGRFVTATEMRCRNTEETCVYVGREEECTNYPLKELQKK